VKTESVKNNLKLFAQLVKFSSIGIISTLVYFILSSLLFELLFIKYSTSSVLAYLCAMIVSYYGQGIMTFKGNVGSIIVGGKFLVISIIGLTCSYSFVYFVETFTILNPLWGTAAACFLIPAVNFVVMRNWVFKD
jgi:putative flippase GtrA